VKSFKNKNRQLQIALGYLGAFCFFVAPCPCRAFFLFSSHHPPVDEPPPHFTTLPPAPCRTSLTPLCCDGGLGPAANRPAKNPHSGTALKRLTRSPCPTWWQKLFSRYPPVRPPCSSPAREQAQSSVFFGRGRFFLRPPCIVIFREGPVMNERTIIPKRGALGVGASGTGFAPG